MKSLTIAVLAVILLATAADAQTAPAVEAVTDESRRRRKVFVTTTEADFVASGLIGTSVTNKQNETIGEIERSSSYATATS